VPNNKAIKLAARIRDHSMVNQVAMQTKTANSKLTDFRACAAFIITDNAADCGKFELIIQLTSG